MWMWNRALIRHWTPPSSGCHLPGTWSPHYRIYDLGRTGSNYSSCPRGGTLFPPLPPPPSHPVKARHHTTSGAMLLLPVFSYSIDCEAGLSRFPIRHSGVQSDPRSVSMRVSFLLATWCDKAGSHQRNGAGLLVTPCCSGRIQAMAGGETSPALQLMGRSDRRQERGTVCTAPDMLRC